MTEGFRPLADILRAARDAQRVETASAPRAEAEVIEAAPPDEAVAGRSEVPGAAADPVSEFGTCVALARLAALEAYERASRCLLERFARDVLARELALSSVDTKALAREALEIFSADEPVAIVVAPGDEASVACGLPLRVDPALSPGDLILEVRDGIVDARLAVRVQLAIDAVLP